MGKVYHLACRMNNTTTESVLSLIISSLGWILLVAASAVFFLVGQPHYYKLGYVQGDHDRFASDLARVQQRFNIPTETTLDTLLGHIKEVKASSLIIETDAQPTNPLLDPYPTVREVTINSATIIRARRAKTQAEVEQDRLAKKADALPFVESAFSFDQLAVGDEILVIATTQDISYAETLTAKELYKNTTPNP